MNGSCAEQEKETPSVDHAVKIRHISHRGDDHHGMINQLQLRKVINENYCKEGDNTRKQQPTD